METKEELSAAFAAQEAAEIARNIENVKWAVFKLKESRYITHREYTQLVQAVASMDPETGKQLYESLCDRWLLQSNLKILKVRLQRNMLRRQNSGYTRPYIP